MPRAKPTRPRPKGSPYCWVVAPAEVSPSAAADAEADGCLETTACPLIEELPAAAVLPAGSCVVALPPKAPLIPLPSTLLCPGLLFWPEVLLCPPPLRRPLLAEGPELGCEAVEACPVPVSAPLVAPLALRLPSAGSPGSAIPGCASTAPWVALAVPCAAPEAVPDADPVTPAVALRPLAATAPASDSRAPLPWPAVRPAFRAAP